MTENELKALYYFMLDTESLFNYKGLVGTWDKDRKKFKKLIEEKKIKPIW